MLTIPATRTANDLTEARMSDLRTLIDADFELAKARAVNVARELEQARIVFPTPDQRNFAILCITKEILAGEIRGIDRARELT